MGIPGEDKVGVMDGVDFLHRLGLNQSLEALGRPPTEKLPEVHGKRVAVVGGGDVAIDVARCALRLGAREVHVIYRRAGDDMPAAHLPDEIEAARQEGVHFHTLVAPVEILGEDQVKGLRLQQLRLADFDETARRRPVPLGAEAYTLRVDLVIPAIGHLPDTSWNKSGDVHCKRGGTFVVNEAFATSIPGLFAAGDIRAGSIRQTITAAGDGAAAAVAAGRFLAH